MPRAVELIVIHCSASADGVSLFEGRAGEPSLFRAPVQVIDGWHAKRGFTRSSAWRKTLNESLGSIGYHFVLYTNGAIVTGRHMDEVGAHAHVAGKTYNQKSIGVCMVGTERFTPGQWSALSGLVTELRAKYPGASICGHRDLSPDLDDDGVVEPHEWLKTCPGFDVAAWLQRGMAPLPEDVFQEPAKESS